MTCPTCNDAGFIETRTIGGLVERKACAHTVATGLQSQQNGDMATNGVNPVVTAGPSQTSQGVAAGGLPDASKSSRSASWPFDPEPRALEPAQNGFHWCRGCESVQPVTGHECGGGVEAPASPYTARVRFERFAALSERAEFAESLLCAMAFDHGAALLCVSYVFHMARAFGPCPESDGGNPGGCIFCDAARGGGR